MTNRLKKGALRTRRRSFRVRNHLRKNSSGGPRLVVFRSNRQMYAQIVDDATGNTLCAVNTLQPGVGGDSPGTKDAALQVGIELGKRALAANIQRVVFDRGKFRYHGRVAAVADGARQAGLQF